MASYFETLDSADRQKKCEANLLQALAMADDSNSAMIAVRAVRACLAPPFDRAAGDEVPEEAERKQASALVNGVAADQPCAGTTKHGDARRDEEEPVKKLAPALAAAGVHGQRCDSYVQMDRLGVSLHVIAG